MSREEEGAASEDDSSEYLLDGLGSAPVTPSNSGEHRLVPESLPESLPEWLPESEPEQPEDDNHGLEARGCAFRQENIARARAVLTALRRVQQRQQAEERVAEEAQVDGCHFTFSRYHSDTSERMTHQDVTDIVFSRHVGKTDNLVRSDHNLNAAKLLGIRRWTIWRYIHHRQQSWQDQLRAAHPLQLLCMSMLLKWDETQQSIHCYMEDQDGQPDEHEENPQERPGLQQTVQVMSAIAYLKTSSMARPWPWIVPPKMLERTTAENIFTGLAALSPLDLTGTKLPSIHVVRWIWFVTVADQASSNKRLQAHLESLLLAARPGILTCNFPCIVHIMHRGVVPLLTLHSMNTKLFRANNVLRVMSYWKALYLSVMGILAESLVIVHNYDRREHHRALLEALLRLVWCDTLPDELLPKKKIKVMRSAMESFVGNVASTQILFQCSRPGCKGGVACRSAALNRARSLITVLLFSRRPVDPSISRWWKCTPLLRVVCIGLCLHGLLSRACPRKSRRAAGALQHGEEGEANDDAWHAAHNWRCDRTWEFFNAGDTCCNLQVILNNI